MTALYRALGAEAIKARRTLTLGLAFLAPLAITFLVLVMSYQQGEHVMRAGEQPWLSLWQQTLILWSLLMLPLFITLETALLSATEHGNHTWKQLYALPVPRWAVYAAKEIIAIGLIALSMLVLCGLTAVDGWLLTYLRPDLGLTEPFPWLPVVEAAGLTSVTSWVVISLHMWISQHWSSFVVAIGTGMVATVAAVLVVQSDYAQIYPWTLPGVVALDFMNGLGRVGLSDGISLEAKVAAGMLCGILIAVIGGWEVTHRDVLS